MTEPHRRLATGYYVDNFEAVLATVAARDADLLAEDERAFLDAWQRLALDARRLYVRLATRRGPWFRPERLDYPEIDVPGAIAGLVDAGLAVFAGETESAARLGELDRAELRAWLRDRGSPVGGTARRAALLAAAGLAAAAPDAAAALARRAPLFALRGLAALRVFRLLYFGNLAQDWSEFVLRDLGVLRFEAVPLARDSRPFSDRAAVERHLENRALGEAVEEALRAGDLARAAELVETVPERRLAGPDGRRDRRRTDRVLLAVARELERRGEIGRALALYARAEQPPARERRVRILARRGGLAEAARLVDAMAAEPRDESERVFAASFGARLAARRAGRPARRRTSPTSWGERELPARPDPAGAEAAALAALAAEGYRGFFAENWLWRALFGLAFWDLLFAPLPGAFVHPFQLGPLDLYDGFREARADAVARRLSELRAAPSLAPLMDTWERKFGIANALVPFEPCLEPHLRFATAALDGARLAVVCDRLSRDLGRYAAGLPDLFLVDARGDVLLAEVKAPGDTLRPEQRGWLAYLADSGLAATVLRLRWRAP